MSRYIVSSEIDPTPYRATSAVPAVGVEGTLNRKCRDYPDGMLPIRMFSGDLGYQTDGTKEKPEDDDFITLYLPVDCLTRLT